MQNAHRFIIATDAPFRGCTQSATYIDTDGVERVAYTDRLTFEDYKKERGEHFRLVEWPELEAMLQAHYASLVTNPLPISEDRFNELLECLPPCRYGHIGGFTVFHISERLTANLVQWCAQNGSMSCYEFTDRDNMTKEELLQKLTTIKTGA